METQKITMAGFKTIAKIGAASWIHEGHTSDFQNRKQVARRADGVWFVRYQDRHPRYGYRWGAWRATSDQGNPLGFTFKIARLPS